MCLNEQHLWTIATGMALAVHKGQTALSTVRIEFRVGGVNGTSVLLGLGTKLLFLNEFGNFNGKRLEGARLLFQFQLAWTSAVRFRYPFLA